VTSQIIFYEDVRSADYKAHLYAVFSRISLLTPVYSQTPFSALYSATFRVGVFVSKFKFG
jgi:hypothetical protein